MMFLKQRRGRAQIHEINPQLLGLPSTWPLHSFPPRGLPWASEKPPAQDDVEM